MSAQWWLRQQADIFEGTADRLTDEIEDVERRIVELRRLRDDARLNRADALAAADVLDNVDFRVERDVVGGVTVYVDPPAVEKVREP